MEPRAKTLMEQFGFLDAELKTKKHDSIIFSLMDGEIMKEVVFSAYPEIMEGMGYWASDLVVPDPEVMHRVMEFPTWDIIKEEITPHEICELFRSEYPESSINVEYVKGLILRLQEESEEFRSLERPSVDVVSFYPIFEGVGEDKAIVGYVDFFVTLNYRGTTHFSPFKSSRNCIYEFFVEVRTGITSVGDVLRQMRTYMEFTDAKPILVAPVSRKVKDAMESQGVPVYVWEL